MGALEGGVVSLVAVRDMRAWALGWDSRLVASVYSVSYYLYIASSCTISSFITSTTVTHTN